MRYRFLQFCRNTLLFCHSICDCLTSLTALPENVHMDEPQKPVLIDTNPKDAEPEAKMSQPKIRTLVIIVIIVIILALIAAAIITFWPPASTPSS